MYTANKCHHIQYRAGHQNLSHFIQYFASIFSLFSSDNVIIHKVPINSEYRKDIISIWSGNKTISSITKQSIVCDAQSYFLFLCINVENWTSCHLYLSAAAKMNID